MGIASTPVGAAFCLFVDVPAILTAFLFLVDASVIACSNRRLDLEHGAPVVLLSVLGPVIEEHLS
jgi:hypothetical protein